MKPTSSINCFVLLLSTCLGVKIHAQFQMEWESSAYFGTGNIVLCIPDDVGGIYVAVQTLDSICNYDLGVITHVNANSDTVWTNSLYYETPCLTQNLQTFLREDDHLYYSIQDTSGWIVKADSNGSESWKIDTGYTWIANTVDRSGKITAFVPQWKKVFCVDSFGSVLWNYTLPYTFSADIRAIVNDKEGGRIVAFDYINPQQNDTRGVGLLKLDSTGQFMWDTLINGGTSPDEDYFVDLAVDNYARVYLLTMDVSLYGSFVSVIDAAGNGVGYGEFVPGPSFRPLQLELDTVHSIFYVAGRTSNYLEVVRYDAQAQPLDTMYFDKVVPDVQSIAVNEYGYLFHLWTSDSGSVMTLRLEMFNHLGQLIDLYTYFDSTYTNLYPEGIYFDELGNIFLSCNGIDLNFNDISIIMKLSNPLYVPDSHNELSSISIFPNPADNNVSVELPEGVNSVKYSIFSITGHQMLSGLCSSERTSIDTSPLSDGMYVITFQNEQVVYSQKLIINHQ